MNMPEVGLIGDIGATNARFALVQADGSMTPPRVYALNDYPSLSRAIDAYLAEESPTARPGQAVLAVASPITGDQVTLTNHTWTFSIEALRRHVGLRRLRVINDFAANALAIPYLSESDRVQIGAGLPVSDAPIALIGPGTGLGVSALIPTQSGAVPIPGEGGHVTMAPANARESAVLDLMRKRYDHVSAERVLSGPGRRSCRRRSPIPACGTRIPVRWKPRRCSVQCSGQWPAIWPWPSAHAAASTSRAESCRGWDRSSRGQSSGRGSRLRGDYAAT